MTVAAATVTSSRRILAFVSQHWRLAGLVLCGLAPFAPSFLSMRAFLLADNALGFVPLVLPAAALVFWVRSGRREQPSKRDILLDSFFWVPAALLALFVLVFTPARLSWYFWLYRMDLLAAALVTIAAGFIFLGYQQVLRTWQGFALLLLLWPYPVVRLQQYLGGPMERGTVWAAERASGFLALPYEVTGNAFTTIDRGDDNFTIILGQACSGSALTIGFMLTGLVMALLMRGPLMRRVYWVLLGMVLAYLSNWLRVTVLLGVAARGDFDFAFNVVHPALGLVLFGLLTVLMLVLLRPFGLRLDLRAEGPHRVWYPAGGGGKPLYASYLTAAGLAVLFGVLSAQSQEYSFLGAGEGAPRIDVTSDEAIMPKVEGWTLAHYDDLQWTDLFGEQARGDLFGYESPDGGPTVLVQTVIAADRTALQRYRIEQCILFHRRKVEAREFVTLTQGVTGVIVHDTYEGVPGSWLYWEQPVTVAGETRHARVALLLDTSEPARAVEVRALPEANSLAQRFGVDLTSRFDGKPRSGQDARVGIDLTLIELASKVLDEMVRTGGPAASGVPSSSGGG